MSNSIDPETFANDMLDKIRYFKGYKLKYIEMLEHLLNLLGIEYSASTEVIDE